MLIVSRPSFVLKLVTFITLEAEPRDLPSEIENFGTTPGFMIVPFLASGGCITGACLDLTYGRQSVGM